MEDNGSVTLMILLSQASSVPFEVEINTINLMARGCNYLCLYFMHIYSTDFCLFTDTEDYDEGNRTIIILPGIEMQAFAINIIDNNIVECNEMFNVTITSVTTCGVTIGSDRVSEVMIRDDDSK